MKDNEIKSLTPSSCPHCGKPIVVELTAGAPTLSSILTIETIEAAKNEAQKQVEALNLSEEKKKPVLDWIKNPETIFGPNDVGEIIKSLKEE